MQSRKGGWWCHTWPRRRPKEWRGFVTCSGSHGLEEGRAEDQRPPCSPVWDLPNKFCYPLHHKAVTSPYTLQGWGEATLAGNSASNSTGYDMKLTYFRVKAGANYFHPKIDFRVRFGFSAKVEVGGSTKPGGGGWVWLHCSHPLPAPQVNPPKSLALGSMISKLSSALTFCPTTGPEMVHTQEKATMIGLQYT